MTEDSIKNKNDLKEGEIVSIVVEALNKTDDGFLLKIDKDDGMEVYEKIDLDSYPSFDDFKGDSSKVNTGDIGTVFKYIGRPHRITGEGVWNNYDIYEVLIHGKLRQIFRRNLLTLKELKELN